MKKMYGFFWINIIHGEKYEHAIFSSIPRVLEKEYECTYSQKASLQTDRGWEWTPADSFASVLKSTWAICILSHSNQSGSSEIMLCQVTDINL